MIGLIFHHYTQKILTVRTHKVHLEGGKNLNQLHYFLITSRYSFTILRFESKKNLLQRRGLNPRFFDHLSFLCLLCRCIASHFLTLPVRISTHFLTHPVKISKYIFSIPSTQLHFNSLHILTDCLVCMLCAVYAL